VWFGFVWEEVNPRRVHEVLARALALIEQPAERRQALAGADPADTYLALWSAAFEDAPAVIGPAAQFLSASDPAMRFVGVHALAQIGLPEAHAALLPALDDEDLQVAGYALIVLRRTHVWSPAPDFFERLERLVPRFPRKPSAVKPLVWSWLTISVRQSYVA